jgi:hypothetical protein
MAIAVVILDTVWSLATFVVTGADVPAVGTAVPSELVIPLVDSAARMDGTVVQETYV